MDEDLKATIAAAADTRATVATAADAQAADVADRIREWFRERPAWIQPELVSRAWREDIDLMAWYDHPRIRALGLRGVIGPKWDGAPALFFVLDAEAAPLPRLRRPGD